MQRKRRRQAAFQQQLAFREGLKKRKARGRFHTTRRFATSGELKFHDVDLSDAVIAGTGTVTASINLIAQGITESARIGRKCTIRRIMWRFRLTLPATTVAADTTDSARLILFQDKSANGATAGVTGTSGLLASAVYTSFNNLNNTGRFRVLSDKMYTLSAPSGGTSAAGVHQFGEFSVDDTIFRNVNIPIEFSAETGAITEIRTNNLGILVISANGVLALTGKIRLRFSDG